MSIINDIKAADLHVGDQFERYSSKQKMFRKRVLFITITTLIVTIQCFADKKLDEPIKFRACGALLLDLLRKTCDIYYRDLGSEGKKRFVKQFI